jgi:hypothetical protein
VVNVQKSRCSEDGAAKPDQDEPPLKRGKSSVPAPKKHGRKAEPAKEEPRKT